MSPVSACFKLGIASFLIPAAAFLISIAIQALIPGCLCDEGAGCHGCGLNGLMAHAMFDGLIGAIIGVFIVFPAFVVLGMVFAMISNKP
ncbi:MAG: hypothetical protein WA071_14475 [Undibacterium umbellatum]|uniref:hypothetical protein n=1 Tax=Undibacterium umbellatum TaxID=2762300 RepID=UPI003BB53CAE